MIAFSTCQGDISNGENDGQMNKTGKIGFFIEDNSDESIDVPPPPWGQSFNADGTELKGYHIAIAENTVLGISHIYRKETGPESQGLMTLFIIEKGDMALTWADPKYTTDNRLDHINQAIRNNSVMVIAVHEIRFFESERQISAENFWARFKMTKTPPHPLAPEIEYYVSSVSGLTGSINIINGTLKVL